MTKIQIVFYSMCGHLHRLAEAVAAGARDVGQMDVRLLQVPELVPEESRFQGSHVATIAAKLRR